MISYAIFCPMEEGHKFLDCTGAEKEVGTWLIIGQLLRASQVSRCYGIIYKKGSNVTSW